MTSSKRGRKK